MIIVVNVCSDGLSYLEFVKPVEDVLKKARVRFVTRCFVNLEKKDVDMADRFIICGTALRDFAYLENLDRFKWIYKVSTPILGICAGMQIIGKLFGGILLEQERIGRYRVNIVQRTFLSEKSTFYSYFLSSKALEPNNEFETLGESDDLKCIIKHKHRRLYGCLFHPEVLNPEIITSFSILDSAR